MVRCGRRRMSGALLVSMLLNGGCGYEDFRLYSFSRSSIGFDHLFDLLNNPQLTEDQGGYPPYDIVRTGPDTYRIAVAIAGFTPDEITVTSRAESPDGGRPQGKRG